MVNKERVALLVQALRSGRYRQTTNRLAKYFPKQQRKRYCCLGVACEVARRNGLNVKVERDDYSRIYAYDGNNSTLPDSVLRWYGFNDSNPILKDTISAAQLNDLEGWTFRQIADAFEERYLK